MSKEQRLDRVKVSDASALPVTLSGLQRTRGGLSGFWLISRQAPFSWDQAENNFQKSLKMRKILERWLGYRDQLLFNRA